MWCLRSMTKNTLPYSCLDGLEMKIDYCSDLHLEMAPVTLPGGDVLILAGDICEGRELIKDFNSVSISEEYTPGEYKHRYVDFFFTECKKYNQVFYVMGNHEFYHSRFDKLYDELITVLPTNVTLLEQDYAEYGGVVFMGSTLWTNANKMCAMTIHTLKQRMADYKHIKYHDVVKDVYHKLTPEVTVAKHTKTVASMKQWLPKLQDKPVVVISHHAPSAMSVAPEYRGEHYLNGGYYSDLSELILDNQNIKFWVHGHVHNQFDYEIGTTRVLCNPRGYYGYEQSANDFKVLSFEI